MVKFLRRWKIRILLFFAVVGPGIITANVDNDAGGILTYSQAGAQYGLLLLWTMIPVTLALIVVQEMSARMGAVTGKGLSDLIREEFGFRITFFMMIGILFVNFGNVVTEFIGIATSLELFGLSRFITVPVCAVIVWLIVVKGQYTSVEAARLDVVTGCICSDGLAWFIIVACAAPLYVHGYRDIKYAADAAQALRPLAGAYAYTLFAVGLFNASLFAGSILPLSTAYTVCEGLGFESGVGRKFAEAPFFYWLYTLLIAAGGALVLIIPSEHLVRIVIWSQVLNG